MDWTTIESMLGKWPASVLDWATLVGVIVAAPWAIVTFRRSNRIKAAEIILALEASYKEHIDTLLQIEYLDEYIKIFKPALERMLSGAPSLTPQQSKAIDKLERVLRYFFSCVHVRRLRVDSSALAPMCAWYLRVMCDSQERPELREYIRRYWPAVFFWSELVGLPWPRRVLRFTRQIPNRCQYWWVGQWAFPVTLRTREESSVDTNGTA